MADTQAALLHAKTEQCSHIRLAIIAHIAYIFTALCSCKQMGDNFFVYTADANLADEGTHTGQGNSSRAVSEAPSISGQGIPAASKKVKRSRSNTPEGGFAAQHYSWDNHNEGAQPKFEPSKSEWQGFESGHAQDPHAMKAEPQNAAGTHGEDSSQFANNQHVQYPASEQHMEAVKQEQNMADPPSTKRTGLKIKLKFKPG